MNQSTNGYRNFTKKYPDGRIITELAETADLSTAVFKAILYKNAEEVEEWEQHKDEISNRNEINDDDKKWYQEQFDKLKHLV